MRVVWPMTEEFFKARPDSEPLDSVPFVTTVVLQLLTTVAVPKEPFDPNGEWEHRYSMWLLATRRDHEPRPAGCLTVRRALLGKTVQFSIEQMSTYRGPGAKEQINATIGCAKDALSAPISWRVESEILNANGEPVGYTSWATEGRSDGKTQIACNWCLFDAVQRMPFVPEAICFDLLEDLALPKRNHSLQYRETLVTDLAGGPAPVHRFEQTGEGILPTNYWLDDDHRLLMVVGGVRAYVLEGEST